MEFGGEKKEKFFQKTEQGQAVYRKKSFEKVLMVVK